MSDDNITNKETKEKLKTQDKWWKKINYKFALEVIFMLVVGFLVIYPLALFGHWFLL